MKKLKQEYVDLFFSVIKKKNSILMTDKKTHFNETEMCLIREILEANKKDSRLISTQLASRLGVTRSAISQIVNRLEKAEVVKRVPDAVNKKIYYVELLEGTEEKYNEDLAVCGDFITKTIEAFGEEKFALLCKFVEEFSVVAEEQKDKPKKRAYKKKMV